MPHIAHTVFRRNGRAAVLLAALGLLIGATGAQAQYPYGYARAYPEPYFDDPPLPPRAVVYRLQDRGFSEITRPRFDGRAYIVEATNPMGARVRLFVDAHDGRVIGRERLDVPYYPGERVARAAPGYGWTEEDAAPRPPADIPGRPGMGEAAKSRPAQPKRTAKLVPPTAQPAPKASPDAPAPKIAPPHADTPKVPATPSEPAKAASEPPKADAPPIETAKTEPPPVKPAAHNPAADGETTKPTAKVEPPAPEPAKVEPAKAKPPKTEEAKNGSEGGWKDPSPSDEPRKKVRVIGGATVVPGGGGADMSGTN